MGLEEFKLEYSVTMVRNVDSEMIVVIMDRMKENARKETEIAVAELKGWIRDQEKKI